MDDEYKHRVRLLVVVAVSCLAFVAVIIFALIYRSGEGSLFGSDKQSKSRTAPSAPSAEKQREQPDFPLRDVSGEKISVLICGLDKSEQITDVIMLAVFDTDASKINVLQIPRDTFIGSEYPTGKINSIYSLYEDSQAGLAALKEVVEAKFLIPVDYTVTVTLDAFIDLVDQIGGVPVELPEEIALAPGMNLPMGKQVLTGEQAELLVRFRTGYLTADIGRLQAQSVFLNSLFEKVKTMDKKQLLMLVAKNYKSVKTDMSTLDMMSFAEKAIGLKSGDISFYTVPGDNAKIGGYSVYKVDKQGLAELLNRYFLKGRIDGERLAFPAYYERGHSNDFIRIC